jgi:hypothetical protein
MLLDPVGKIAVNVLVAKSYSYKSWSQHHLPTSEAQALPKVQLVAVWDPLQFP